MLELGVVPIVYVCVAESVFFVEDIEEEDLGDFKVGKEDEGERRIRARVIWLKIFHHVMMILVVWVRLRIKGRLRAI